MHYYSRIVISGLVFSAVSLSADLILPGPALERDQPVTVTFKTGRQATGKGGLHILWTDVFGRTVEERTIAVDLSDENEIRFPLDLRRAVAMQNELKVHFSFNGLNKKGEEDKREEDATVPFVARPPDTSWWDYMVIMWQGGSADRFAKLEKIGVNAGKSNEHSDQLPEFLLKNDLRWYVENMATDFYSAYHIYRPDRPYNFSLLEAKELNRKYLPGQNGSGNEGLKRHPSFSDPAWLSKIHDRLVEGARAFSPYRPIFYNLADESGIAELAGFWDFDFSDHSLEAMRTWLKGRYGTLAGLNRQWGSSFGAWYLVTPETTAQAMKRQDENYSSWGDFKEWMDISFADALKMGANAIHSVDPHAYVGIEGAQMPGWGGYDYARLSAALDVMEPYDIGDNIEIIRSFKPQLAFLTTAFATGPQEMHRVWYELLHGARGHIIWDEKNDVVDATGSAGARGREVAPYWNELRSGIGALTINSVRQSDPIAIHYSQASMRTEWMMAQRSKEDAWMDRMSWTERKDSEFLFLRDSYCRLIEDHGLQYNFVSYAQVEDDELIKHGYRMLILPRSSALAEAESKAIIAFVRQGGILLVDGDAGTFDEHSRRLPKSSLASLLEGEAGHGKVLHLNAIDYRRDRVLGTGAQTYEEMRKAIEQAGIHAEFGVIDEGGKRVSGIETHVFRNGGSTIVGLLSNPPIEVDDLGPLKAKSEQRFEKSRAVRLIAPEELYAYDVRRAKPLGRVRQVLLTIDPYEPTIIAFSPTPVPKLHVRAPQRVRRGETGHVSLGFDGRISAQTDVVHITVRSPDGQIAPQYSKNLLAPGGVAEAVLPLAVNDPPGRWTMRVHELLGGQENEAAFDVF